jgi:hypothetical protein
MVKREITEEGEVRTKRMLFQMEDRDQGEDYSSEKGSKLSLSCFLFVSADRDEWQRKGDVWMGA